MVGWVENHWEIPQFLPLENQYSGFSVGPMSIWGGLPSILQSSFGLFLGGKEVSLFPSLKERGRKSDHQFTLLAIPNMHLSGFSVGPVSGISAMWQSPPGGRRPRECLQLERCQQSHQGHAQQPQLPGLPAAPAARTWSGAHLEITSYSAILKFNLSVIFFMT